MIAKLALSLFIQVANRFAATNKKDAHQPFRSEGLNGTVTMMLSSTPIKRSPDLRGDCPADTVWKRTRLCGLGEGEIERVDSRWTISSTVKARPYACSSMSFADAAGG